MSYKFKAKSLLGLILTFSICLVNIEDTYGKGGNGEAQRREAQRRAQEQKSKNDERAKQARALAASKNRSPEKKIEIQEKINNHLTSHVTSHVTFPVGRQIWSSGGQGSLHNAYEHADKHKREFPELVTKGPVPHELYVQHAHNFIASPPPGTRMKVDPQTKTKTYLHVETGTFAAAAEEHGTPKTLFKPNYNPNNPAQQRLDATQYFDDQPGREIAPIPAPTQRPPLNTKLTSAPTLVP